ncbi:hypothetical protein FJ936_09070 [Mesorhizobium sp. B2-4-13]|uniref:hypothetical protein n=1 Tax=Mesorhizobium sp. B2-4-13 TaxID=2589936 RepID=UPI00114DF46B|nr:hypothetical protein [Mesorhizobium sp. B2-4-13]TPK85679.1 hypothetical protein FJ936_09070 [Mesorhizobium sp. B2-4-13]
MIEEKVASAEFSGWSAVIWFLVFAGGLLLTGLAGVPAGNLRGEGFHPLDITVMRTVSVGLVFFLLVLVRWCFVGLPVLRPEHLKALIVFAVFGVVLTNGGTTLSVALVPSYVAIPVIFAMSIATAMVIDLVAKNAVDKLDIGVSLALVVLVAVLVGAGAGEAVGFHLSAIAVPVMTGVAQGVAYHAVGGSKDLDALTFYSFGFGIGGAVMVVTSGALGVVDFKLIHDKAFEPDIAAWLSMLSVGMTVLPYLMIRAAATKLSMIAKGSAGSAEPVGGVAADYLQGHQLEVTRVLLVVTIIGVVLANQLRKRGS